MLLQAQGLNPPPRPEHIGAEWVLEAADSAYVHHALSLVEVDDDIDSGDLVIDRMMAAGTMQVKF